MALRTFLLILAAALGPLPGNASPVQRYPLDDRMVYAVAISPAAPTTVMFPGPLAALDGAGVSRNAEDEPAILLSHQPGSPYFAVRALHPDATGAANVVFRDRVYAFTFATAEEPDRVITFHEAAPGPTRDQPVRPRADRLLALLDRARHHAAIAAQYPALARQVARATPGTTTESGTLTATIEEVLGFAAEDALVFRVRLENRGQRTCRYDPARLAVRVGRSEFPVALTDASGELPAGQAEIIRLVIVGQPDGTPARLTVHNLFSLPVPLLE